MDCEGAVMEGLQERQPAGFGKGAKKTGNFLQLGGGHWFVGSRFHITQ